MKNLITLGILTASFSSFANFYPNHSWNYSTSSCKAYTRCPNGRVISYEVYGSNYGNVPSYMSNQCRAMVLPGRFVNCEGYVQSIDAWGNWTWLSAKFPVSC